ncbi:carboxymuconolactone decarboxylase family protein [Dermatobacter hominis]|uniref:carboxymuconolactone decarboxylase family protein n=1 Tax=Dermatobacter hominis TaxID=2884263 RepID=UPI001D0F5A8D|nr:carboxymuconolactone decarboxylase family protein [Dermatobacter hominis]UDY36567.1 carboxymuconolactone decarboxylase family protein [Dermatobacter hominis]
MSDPHTPPKIAPLADADATEAQLAALEPLGPMAALHIFRTLAVHPKLFRSWLPFGGRLLQGSTLTPRARELAILRTAALCGSDYEWGQHVGIGRDAGLSDDEILACAVPTEPGGWDAVDLAVLTATEELVDGHRMSDATWDALTRLGWTDQQLIELTMLAGHYAMLAGMLRSVGVEPEGPLPAIGHVRVEP